MKNYKKIMGIPVPILYDSNKNNNEYKQFISFYVEGANKECLEEIKHEIMVLLLNKFQMKKKIKGAGI